MVRRKGRLFKGVRQIEERGWIESETAVVRCLVGSPALYTVTKPVVSTPEVIRYLKVRKHSDFPFLLIPYFSSQVLLI